MPQSKFSDLHDRTIEGSLIRAIAEKKHVIHIETVDGRQFSFWDRESILEKLDLRDGEAPRTEPEPSQSQILTSLLQKLNLTHMASDWEAIEKKAIKENWSHAQFLMALAEAEADGREQANTALFPL